LERVIKGTPRDKISGLNGWNQEFYSSFFDIISSFLLRVVEESRLDGRVAGALNSTFVTLIPKESNPSSLSHIHLTHFVTLFIK